MIKNTIREAKDDNRGVPYKAGEKIKHSQRIINQTIGLK